jgi:diketogulonate reductase-like aldo/keto reductase
LTKSIGVSNFREEDILELEKTWEIPPAVNQVSAVSTSAVSDRLRESAKSAWVIKAPNLVLLR